MLRILKCLFLGALSLELFAEDEMPVYDLEEYTVRAWHFDKSLMDVPGDVTRVDRRTIDRSLALSVPELLATEANLFFSEVSGFGNVAMRGFGENSGLRSLILIDGQPLNPADMGRVNWEQASLGAIESIEVLRGGNNVLYGDKALAGVIKIETRRSGERRAEFEARAGSFGFEQFSANGGFGGDFWSVSGGGFRQETEGYRENSESQTRSGHLSAGLTFPNDDDLDLRVAMGETDLTYPDGLSYERYLMDPRSSTNSGEKGSQNAYLTSTVRYRGERDWGQVEILGGYDHNETSWTFGGDSDGDNEQFGYSFKPRIRFGGDEMAVIIGGDFLYDGLDFYSPNEGNRAESPAFAELSESRASPYFLLEKTFANRLTLSGGGRHEWVRYEVDYEQSTFDSRQLDPFVEFFGFTFPNPAFQDPPDVLFDNSYSEVIREDGSAAELSLNYRLRDELSIWVGYDRVYRYPVFDERAAYQGFPLAEDVSQDLEAEVGDNFELGLKYIEGSHEFFATAFFLSMENEIAFDPSITNVDTLISGLNVNLGAVRRYGADVSYFYESNQWGFSIQAAGVDTEIREGLGKGSSVPLVPDFRVTSQIWCDLIPSIRVRATHRYVGKRFQGGDFENVFRRVEDYDLIDLGLTLTLSPNFRAYLSLNNAFDELYATGVYNGQYYPGDGRSLHLGAKLNF